MNLFYYSCEEDAIIFGIVFVKKATQRKIFASLFYYGTDDVSSS